VHEQTSDMQTWIGSWSDDDIEAAVEPGQPPAYEGGRKSEGLAAACPASPGATGDVPVIEDDCKVVKLSATWASTAAAGCCRLRSRLRQARKS